MERSMRGMSNTRNIMKAKNIQLQNNGNSFHLLKLLRCQALC